MPTPKKKQKGKVVVKQKAKIKKKTHEPDSLPKAPTAHTVPSNTAIFKVKIKKKQQ